MYFKSIKRGVIVLVLFLIVIQLTNAFGVSTPYIENNTLKVTPGNTYIYTITIQNGDDEDYYVNITHTLEEMVRLNEYSRYVPSKTYNTTFDFIISVPENLENGKLYNLEYTARPRVNDTGTITMGVELKRTIQIVITDEKANIPFYTGVANFFSDEPAKKTYKYLLISLSILIGVVIIFRIWKLSRGISFRLHTKNKTHLTISESKTLTELKNIIDNMSDKEFELLIIKKLIKHKLIHLKEENLSHHIAHIDRADLAQKIEQKIK